MKLRSIFNEVNLELFLRNFEKLRVPRNENIDDYEEKYILLVRGEIVLPIIITKFGLELIRERGYFDRMDIEAYKIDRYPIDFFDPDRLPEESKKDIEALMERIKPS